MQNASISGSMGWDQDMSGEGRETKLWGEADSIFKLLHFNAWKLNPKQKQLHLSLCQQNPLHILLWWKRNHQLWNYNLLLLNRISQNHPSKILKIQYHSLMLNYCLQSNLLANPPSKPKVVGKLREPETFTGKDPKQLKPFFFQCKLYFWNLPETFWDNSTKVNFALSYLRDVVQEWFEPGISGELDEIPD